jgi:hypothetical protein
LNGRYTSGGTPALGTLLASMTIRFAAAGFDETPKVKFQPNISRFPLTLEE